MHEMSIAINVVDIITKQAQVENAKKINKVELEIGVLAGVMVESLQFCFKAACKDTMAENAKMTIIAVPGKGNCLDCNKTFPLDTYLASCPNCQSFSVDIIQGREMKIRSINID